MAHSNSEMLDEILQAFVSCLNYELKSRHEHDKIILRENIFQSMTELVLISSEDIYAGSVCVFNYGRPSPLSPYVIPITGYGDGVVQRHKSLIAVILNAMKAQSIGFSVIIWRNDRLNYLCLNMDDISSRNLSELKLKLAIRGFL